MLGRNLDVSKTNKSKSKVPLILTTTLALLLWIPFVLAANSAYEKCVVYEQNSKEKHFSDVATMGKLRVLDCLGRLTEVVNEAGITLSLTGTDSESVNDLFSSIYKSTEAEIGLIYAKDGTLIYGDKVYDSVFFETAREARSSGGSSVSELVECRDGVKRLGIAAPFMAPDGKTGVVMNMSLAVEQ